MAYYNNLSGIIPAEVESRFWAPMADFSRPAKDANPGSPMWWAWRLHAELLARWPLVVLYEDYYEGRHKLGLSTAEYRKVFGKALAPVSDPWMSLVVGASAERLDVQGFRLGEGELEADDDAWGIWQANDLDEDAGLAFTEAIKLGESYMLVWPEKGQDVPRMTVEHPGQMVVARAPGDRRRMAAAMKFWQDIEGLPVANLYLPDRIIRMRWDDSKGWRPREERGSPSEEISRLGVVPVAPLVNDPHMLPCYPPVALTEEPHSVPPSASIGLGRSDMADVISTQDQINKLLCDLLIASEFGAHRQVFMTGVDNQVDAAGNPIPLEVGASRVVSVEEENARIGNLAATDLANYVRPIEQRIQSIASRTRVPVHYFPGGSGNFPSGDALRAAETGLVAKVKRKHRSFGGGLERAMRLAFAWMNDPRKNAVRAEIDWRDPEYRTESEHVDAQVKKLALGIPAQQIWEDVGYSPQEIERMRAMIRQAAIEGALVDPLAVNPNGAQPEPAPAAA